MPYPHHRHPELSDEALFEEARELRLRGRYDQALERVEELTSRLSVSRVPARDSRWGELLALSSALALDDGQVRRSTELAQKLLDDARRHHWPRLRAEALLCLARCARRRGEYGRAESLAQEALRSLRERRVPAREARALMLLAELAETHGETEQAEQQLLEAMDIFGRIGEREHLPRAMTTLAGLYRRQGRIDEASALLGESAELARQLNLDIHLATSLYSLGLLHHHSGDDKTARPYMRRALALFRHLNYARGVHHACIGLGEIERARGRLDAADALYQEVSDAGPDADLRTQQIAWLNRGLVAVRRERWEDARAALEHVRAQAQGDVRSTCLAFLLTAQTGLGEVEAWDRTERAWRAGRDAYDPVEIDIARSLELAGVMVMRRFEEPIQERPQGERPCAGPRSIHPLSRAARPLAAALQQYTRLRRDADRARCARLLRELGERGAPIPLGPFDLTAVLGSGGMGEVWRACHRDEGVPVAIKVLTSHAARSHRGREALRREVRAVATLNHPGIVPIFAHSRFGEAAAEMTGRRLKADNPCIAIELVGGGSLAPWCGRLSWKACRGTLLQLLDALAHAHARGLVHRDIKPDNLLIDGLDADGLEVRLSDFGLAQAMGEASHTGIVGTPGYMAPEQFTGAWRQLGPWTDLYAVGCLGWALVTGAPPFANASVAELRDAHLSRPPPRLRPTRPVPPGFEGWLRRLLRKAPEDRFQRAADAVWALSQLPEPDMSYDGPLREQPATAPASSSTFYFELDPIGVSPLVEEPLPVGARSLPPVPERWEDPGRPMARLSGAGRNLVELREVPLVGRHAERARIWEALRSREPRVVMIRGELGMGCTRLATAALHRAHETGAAVTLRGASGGSSSLATAIARHHRWTGLSTPALLAAARAWLADFGAEEQAWALAEFIRPGTTETPLEGPEARAEVALGALSLMGEGRSVVVLLDDAEDDPEALALAQRLLEDPRRSPVLLLLTLPEQPTGLGQLDPPGVTRLQGKPGVSELLIEPLTVSELQALVQGLLKLDPKLATQIAERSAGVPAIAVQLVTAWIAEDMLVAGEGGFVARTAGPLPLPEQLHRDWAAKVDAVLEGQPADARPSLELAALLGDAPSAMEWLAACAAAQLTPPHDLEDRLLDAGLAMPTPAGWRFVHPLLRESLLRLSSAAGRRERLHLACARALAVHGGSAWARGRHLYDANELVDALPLLMRAIDEGGVAERAEMLACAADALARVGATPEDPRWSKLIHS